MRAILRLDSVPTLITVIDKTIISVTYLHTEDILTCVFERLIDLHVSKLSVIVPPVLVDNNTDAITLNKYINNEVEYNGVISSDDIRLLSNLCVGLGVKTLEVYDMYNVIARITDGSAIKILPLSNFMDRIIVVKDNNIINIEDSLDYSTDCIIDDYKRGFEISKVKSYTDLPSILDVANRFDNHTELEDDIREDVLFCLTILNMKPNYKKGVSAKKDILFQEKTFINKSEKEKKKNPLFKFKKEDSTLEEKIQEVTEQNREDGILDKIENSVKIKERATPQVLGTRALLVSMSVILGATYAVNAIMGEMTSKKITVTGHSKDILEPKQNSLRYYNLYNQKVGSGQPNLDADTYSKIKAIGIGTVGEIKLSKDLIGIKVFFETTDELEQYKAKLQEFTEILEVTDSGIASSGDVQFHKFIISGKLK